MTCEEIVAELKKLSRPDALQFMARYGIKTDKALGVSIPNLRLIAKKAGRDHNLAQQLWDTGIHDARMLASMIDLPQHVTDKQLETWAADFNSWDVCDQCCNNLFAHTPFAWKKAAQWPRRNEEFVRRAGFTLMAVLAVHDKNATDEKFEKLFPLIKKYSTDGRNFVKKAVNWALRQIGKRNLKLNHKCLALAGEIAALDSKSARWIAADAIRELSSSAVRERLALKESRNLQ